VQFRLWNFGTSQLYGLNIRNKHAQSWPRFGVHIPAFLRGFWGQPGLKQTPSHHLLDNRVVLNTPNTKGENVAEESGKITRLFPFVAIIYLKSDGASLDNIDKHVSWSHQETAMERSRKGSRKRSATKHSAKFARSFQENALQNTGGINGRNTLQL
jgi:hypothetical protein